jgi:hypothetical protein
LTATASGNSLAALQKVGVTSFHFSLGRRPAMLDFICPTCGHFSLEEEVCDSCAAPAAEDLVA